MSGRVSEGAGGGGSYQPPNTDRFKRSGASEQGRGVVGGSQCCSWGHYFFRMSDHLIQKWLMLWKDFLSKMYYNPSTPILWHFPSWNAMKNLKNSSIFHQEAVRCCKTLSRIAGQNPSSRPGRVLKIPQTKSSVSCSQTGSFYKRCVVPINGNQKKTLPWLCYMLWWNRNLW